MEGGGKLRWIRQKNEEKNILESLGMDSNENPSIIYK